MISVLRENATLNHCALDSSKTVNLDADNESRGCRMPHERALPLKHWPCGAVKLLKTRGNWMKAVVVTDEKGEDR